MLSRFMKKDTNSIGIITESELMLNALKYGVEVSIPYGDHHKYDQIWDIDGKLYKIQIKTSRISKDGRAFVFNCYSVSNGKKHKYKKDDVDYFATIYNSECYLIPVEECSTEKRLWIDKPIQNITNYNKAEDYELSKVINTLKANR